MKFSYTVGLFKGCKTPKRKPDHISRSGSKYWYGEDSIGKWVIRQSNHWTEKRELNSSKDTGDWVIYQCDNIGTSFWAIKCTNPNEEILTGKCYLANIKQYKKEDK